MGLRFGRRCAISTLSSVECVGPPVTDLTCAASLNHVGDSNALGPEVEPNLIVHTLAPSIADCAWADGPRDAM